MQGLVSILDDIHSAKVESLWQELERELGVQYACVAYPHVTYQVVGQYDVARVEPLVRQYAEETPPFTIQAAGLGIFTGPRPVLYIRIVRDAALTALHDALWSLTAPFASEPHLHHYGHAQWVPHITLAVRDMTHEQLPLAVRLLSQRSFDWTIHIDNLALVLDAEGERDEWMRYPLQGV